MTTAKPITYVAFGDSITVGSKARAAEDRWVSVFAAQVERFAGRPLRVVNAGMGDNTISRNTTNYDEASKPSALERVHDDVIAARPDLVTVAFGLNDMRFGTPADIFVADWRRLLVILREALPAACILASNVFYMSGFATFPPRDRGSVAVAEAYNAGMAAAARPLGVPLADVWAAMNQCDALIHEDGVHAAELGHRLIGNRMFETLASATGFLHA